MAECYIKGEDSHYEKKAHDMKERIPNAEGP